MADQMADQMVDEKADQMVGLKVDQTAALMALPMAGSTGFHWVGMTARWKVGRRVVHLVH